MRVLIVDDEQAFAEPLAQRLELRGIEAAVAGDAETALGMLSRQEWDLVFLDVCLPGMDGVSLLKLLQEHEPRPDVVMLSGATEMSQAVKAMRRGALNWLAKPVSLDAVLEECRKARERAESRRQARRLAEEARLRSLGRIAEGVAHEVNNPLNIIVQAAGLMGDSLDSPEAEALPDIEWFRTHRFTRVSPVLGEVRTTVTVVHAGTQHNVVPDTCAFTVDVRSNELYTNEELLDEIKKNVRSAVVARSTRLNSSHIATDHPLVARCVALGGRPFGSPTLSDQALLPCQSLKLGPGDSARSHTADEYICIDEIRRAIAFYCRLLAGWEPA